MITVNFMCGVLVGVGLELNATEERDGMPLMRADRRRSSGLRTLVETIYHIYYNVNTLAKLLFLPACDINYEPNKYKAVIRGQKATISSQP